MGGAGGAENPQSYSVSNGWAAAAAAAESHP